MRPIFHLSGRVRGHKERARVPTRETMRDFTFSVFFFSSQPVPQIRTLFNTVLWSHIFQVPRTRLLENSYITLRRGPVFFMSRTIAVNIMKKKKKT